MTNEHLITITEEVMTDNFYKNFNYQKFIK